MSLNTALQSPNRMPPGAAQLVVAFRVARQMYALPLAAVLQVVRLPALTMMPEAPPELCGLLNLRGDFVPVLDARAVLGEPPAVTLESQIIVLRAADESSFGLLVDEVDSVRHYSAGSFAPLAQGSDLLVGMLRERDQAAMVLDPQALAARASRGTR
jgi:purine-binding chemotaxis protein CheW